MDILVYEAYDDAERELKRYNENNIKCNEEYNNEYHKYKGISSISDKLDELKNQKRYFVVELAFSNGYAYSATSFPFEGENGFNKDIHSLVRGMKDTIKKRNINYPTIEAIFYTVKDHHEHIWLYPEARGLTEQERQEFIRLYERG